MQEIPMQAQTKKFQHTCKNCGQNYRISLQTAIYTIHRASCPHCNREHFFDNRTGRLDQALGRHDQPTEPEPARVIQDQPRESLVQPRPEKAPAPAPRPVTGAGPSRPRVVRTPESAPRPKSVLRRPSRSRQSPVEKVSEYFRQVEISAWAKIVAVTAVFFMVVTPLFLFITLNITGFYLKDSPETYLSGIKNIRPNRILDRRGQLISELFSRKTGNLKPAEVPKTLKQKLVFTEDQNFYTHGGIHFPSIFRALFTNVFSFGYRQGGSTLTQQLSRILLNDRSKTITRKLREASLTYYIEDNIGKDDIITAYINHVYLGHGAVGMETAASFYFAKKIHELNFVEELVLVSLPSAPARYSPLRNPGLLEAKMDNVYERMEDGNMPGLPSEAEYRFMKLAVLTNLNRSPSESVFGTRVNKAPHVSEYVRQKIKKILGKKYQFSAGLNISTTIDSGLQKSALEESRKHIHRISAYTRPVRMKNGRVIYRNKIEDKLTDAYADLALGGFLFGLPGPARRKVLLQTASVGINPATGEILFLQGGTEFSSGNQLNRAVDMRRQTGSTIKPIVYSAAIESGVLTAASPIKDEPFYARNVKRRRNQKEYYLPGNYDGVYEGDIPVRRALAYSKNVAAIRTAQIVGLPRLSEQFRKFFFYDDRVFKKRFRYDFTVAIGSLEMSPLELASGFGAFGNNGVIKRPYLIRKITNPDGKVLYNGTGRDEFRLKVPRERRVLPGDVAQIMSSIMRDSGRLGGVRRGGFRGNYIGKTGTTNDMRDAWFVGLTPGIVAAVWVGLDNPAYSISSSRGYGATVAGPLWGRIMARAGRGRGSFRFSPSAVSAVICADTGLVPLPQCPRKKKELFARKYVPGKPCDLHKDGKVEEKVVEEKNKDFSGSKDGDFE